MAYKFDWRDFDKEKYDQMQKGINNIWDDCYGNVRIGEICFDVVLRSVDDNVIICFDCYIANKEGYAEKQMPDGTWLQYDYADGFDIEDTTLSYKDFVRFAEKRMTDYINNGNYGYLLKEKANKELLIW